MMIVVFPFDFTRGKILSKIVRYWARIIFFSAGIKTKIIGLENLDSSKNYIFAANHSSSLDIPLMLGFIPFWIVPISKIELKWIPFLGWAIQAGGHFFVDRTNHSRAIDSMDKAKKSMSKNPRSVIIFPEGTRSENAKILPFKKGGLVLAINLDMQVVPLGIVGTGSLVKDKFSSSKNSLKLIFGKPIETKNLTYDDRNVFAFNLRKEVARLVRS